MKSKIHEFLVKSITTTSKKILQITSLLIFTTSFGQNILELNPTNFPVTQPCGFTQFNNKLFYIGSNTAFGREMWLTDGTLVGNQLLKDIGFYLGSPQFGAFGDLSALESSGKTYDYQGKLFFSTQSSYTGVNGNVWTTDGTTAGTISFDPTASKISSLRYFKEFNNRLYFTAQNNSSGREIWSTDGTLAGTTLLKDITPGGNGGVNFDPGFTIMNNKIYFKADDGIHGIELWSTDGTEVRTNMVVDINVGANSTFFTGNGLDEHLKVANNKIFFRGKGTGNFSGPTVLYVTDGSAVGTNKLTYQNVYNNTIVYDGSGLTVLNNTLYFFSNRTILASDGVSSLPQGGIFTTDGTNNGTVLVKDIGGVIDMYVGDNGLSDYETTPNSMRIFNSKAYFLAGQQLWSTDGTESGTTQITNYTLDYQNNRMVSQIFDNKLYFTRNNGPSPSPLTGIYSTDGTSAGTQFEAKQKENNNTTAQAAGIVQLPQQMTSFGSSLYFAASFSTSPTSLWRITNPSLKVNENVIAKLSLFPNPTSSQINLSFENNLESASLKIISLLGQTVLEKQNLSGNNLSLDVQNLSNGVYVIKVTDGELIFNSKFIKQ